MKCPHCRVEIHEGFAENPLAEGGALGLSHRGGEGMFFSANHMQCPACMRPIVKLRHGTSYRNSVEYLVYPLKSGRLSAPAEVVEAIAEDFNEAVKVLEDSPKASAALGRRCLQAVLRDQGYTQHDLAKQVDAILSAKVLPTSLAGNIDLIRNVGNFAAHPMKDTNSGEILPVEPHEAEWNLDVLEGLFDFFYVAPARDKAKRDAFNTKLQAAGKPPLK